CGRRWEGSCGRGPCARRSILRLDFAFECAFGERGDDALADARLRGIPQQGAARAAGNGIPAAKDCRRVKTGDRLVSDVDLSRELLEQTRGGARESFAQVNQVLAK